MINLGSGGKEKNDMCHGKWGEWKNVIPFIDRWFEVWF